MLEHEPAFTLPPLRAGSQYRFRAMIKPVGSLCNLDCAYCYYLPKEALLGHPRSPRMSDEMLERHIKQFIEAQTADEVIFSWQGGEPTLLGLDFFRTVVALQARYKKPHQRIENDLQTNGTLLDAEWAVFLKKHRFLVGLSCDCPEKLHDLYRTSKGGQPTHAKAMAAARLLTQHGVPFNALCVVNHENAKFPLDVYRFLTRELGARQLQLIACVEPRCFAQTRLPSQDAADTPLVTEWSVTPEDWGRFLCKVWDDWRARDVGKVFVNYFENLVAQALGYPSQQCISAEFCGKGLALEHNGDVFSCDHYVYPDYRLGNISDTHWATMAYSERQKAFAFAKRDTLPTVCRECRHLKLCWGECPKNRFVHSANGEAGLNYLCQGLQMYYDHAMRSMPDILRRIDKTPRSFR